MIQTVFAADPVRYMRMTTEELRDAFLMTGLFISKKGPFD